MCAKFCDGALNLHASCRHRQLSTKTPCSRLSPKGRCQMPKCQKGARSLTTGSRAPGVVKRLAYWCGKSLSHRIASRTCYPASVILLNPQRLTRPSFPLIRFPHYFQPLPLHPLAERRRYIAPGLPTGSLFYFLHPAVSLIVCLFFLLILCLRLAGPIIYFHPTSSAAIYLSYQQIHPSSRTYPSC